MTTSRTLPAAARRRLIISVWLCLVSSFSQATPVPPCPANCECSPDSDGGLRIASCEDVRWNGVARPDIRIFELQRSNIGKVCNVPENLSLLFPQLNSIWMRNCSLTSLPSDTFRGLRSLQEVDLSHNSFDHLSWSLFADNRKLHYVNLESNPLNVDFHPLPRSDTVWEVSLARCNLTRPLAESALAGLPNLRHLSLADNKLETLAKNSLPDGLKKLNLSGNSIVNVPLSELHRLKGLKEIDISRNPINCTCQLMGFQNWVSSEGTIFRNQIRCASPPQFAGYSLVDVPQHRLCNVDDQWLASNEIHPEVDRSSSEQFSEVVADKDDFLFDVEISRVVGEERGHRHNRRSASQLEKTLTTDNSTVFEGSGAEETDSVEGSGSGSMDISEITIAPSEPRNVSAPPSTSTADLKEFSNSSSFASEVDSSSQLTMSSPSTDDSSSQPTTVSEDNGSESTNISTPIFVDTGTITPQKEQELIEETTTPPNTVLGISSSSDPSNSTSQQSVEDGMGNSTTTSSTYAEAGVTEIPKEPVTGITLPVSAVSAEVQNLTDRVEDHTVTPQSAANDKIESTTPGQTTVTLEERQQREEAQPVGLGAPHHSLIEHDEATTTPTIDTDSQTLAPLKASENNSDSPTNSSGQLMQDQMKKEERVKVATSSPYIIPSLLIVAVALVCLAIYFSQHSCRSKSWNRNDAKGNGRATELQDVSLLKAENRHGDPDPYSKKYGEAEAQNPQTEKLTNGDRGISDGDYPAEEDGALLADQSLANRQLPPVKKSTTRVTTNYESLPKTPIVIQRS